MPPEVTPDTTPAPAAPPVAPVAPPVPPVQTPVLSPTASFSHADVFDNENKKWRDVANGQKGHILSMRKQLQALEADKTQLQVTIGERDADIARLTQTVQDATASVGTLTALQTENVQLKKDASKAERYKILMQYPQLLQHVDTVVPPPEGTDAQPTTIRTYPMLDMVESSVLEAAALHTTLAAMIAALPTVGPQAPPGVPIAPMIPSPEEPAGDDIASWQAKQNAAHERLKTGDQAAWPEFNEAAEHVRDLIAKQAT